MLYLGFFLTVSIYEKCVRYKKEIYLWYDRMKCFVLYMFPVFPLFNKLCHVSCKIILWSNYNSIDKILPIYNWYSYILLLFSYGTVIYASTFYKCNILYWIFLINRMITYHHWSDTIIQVLDISYRIRQLILQYIIYLCIIVIKHVRLINANTSLSINHHMIV